MSPGGRVADAANLQTAGDEVDHPLRSRLNGFIYLIIAGSDGILPLICKEVLQVTPLEKLSHL